jgi:hypothetical protein
VRDDLAHLTPEALAQLTNAGLVKRALRELAGGYRPQTALDDAHTLTAHFPDGIECHWPSGATIQNARCSCGAAVVCRHRLIAVLAWREGAAADSLTAPAPMRDMASVGDDDIVRLVPAALLRAAERTRAEGLVIDIRRRSSAEPCDTARLPSATVRFWAGGAIEAARCDCVATSACEHVALGVWAFRAAQERHAGDAVVSVRLGPPGRGHALDVQPFQRLVQALLAHGVLQGNSPLAQALTAARAAAADAAWLSLLVADLELWAEAYAQRSALYEASDGVDLIAELGLRLAAGPLPGNAGAVLGIGQAAETALDRLRLMTLGARTRRDGERRLTTLLMADADTGTRLVLRHEWQVPEKRENEEAKLRAAERVAPGVLLDAMAQGQLLAQQAARRADGSIRLARARSSQNSVLPQSGDWAQLAAPLRFASVAALRAEALAHPHAAVQPRHAARRHVVFSPHRIDEVRYDANEQCLIAALVDEAGQTLLLQRTHERHTPHALDAIAAALDGRCGPPRHVAGTLTWADGVPQLEPWALACDQLIVPDFAAHSGALAKVPLGRVPDLPTDACSRALHRLRSHLATALHHGLRRLPARWAHDGEELANSLAADGLQELSRLLRAMQTEVLSPAASAPMAPAFMTLCALRQLHQEALEVQRSTLRVTAGADLGQVSETAASKSTSRNTSLS